jgi:hypothetical protein
MKRTLIIIGLLSIVLLCGFVYAEKQTILGNGAEKQIIVASDSNTCKSECGKKYEDCSKECSNKRYARAAEACSNRWVQDYNVCKDSCSR